MAQTFQHPALAPLKARFGEVKFLAREFRDMVTVVVPRENLVEVCTFLRDDRALRYDMLADLNGVDYLGFPAGLSGPRASAGGRRGSAAYNPGP